MTPPPKKPGRPRLDPNDESIAVHIKMPSREYNRLWDEAQTQRLAVGDLIRLKLAERAEADKK